MKVLSATLLSLSFIVGCNSLNDTDKSTETTVKDPVLRDTIKTYLEERGSNLEEAKYRSVEIDLNEDNIKDALVLFQGIRRCGTGGCLMVVFKGTEQDYSLISKMTLVREPVIVSEVITKGWRDIIVHVSGGGGKTKDVALKFNGSTYPSNPSLEKSILPGKTIDGVEVFPAPSYGSEEDDTKSD